MHSGYYCSRNFKEGIDNTMNNSKLVSTKELFPITIDLLNKGNGVKFTVSGNSMMPWIRSYKDQVLLVPVDKVKKGDIVLYKTEEKYILHRVYRVKNEYMFIMGDGCIHADGYYPLSCAIGKVAKIYRGNFEIDCMKRRWCMLFTLWRYLRFMRKQLFIIYKILAKMKRHLLKPAI